MCTAACVSMNMCVHKYAQFHFNIKSVSVWREGGLLWWSLIIQLHTCQSSDKWERGREGRWGGRRGGRRGERGMQWGEEEEQRDKARNEKAPGGLKGEREWGESFIVL